MKTLILASQSPRRSEILKKENYFFVSFPVHVSEIPDKNLSLNDQIIDIARRKAIACLDLYPDKISDSLILAADTMVCIDEKALGKPENNFDAKKTLQLLSGRIHQVKTAIYFFDVINNEHLSHIETTTVVFKKISNDEIEKYLNLNEHQDKAGSYGIQGSAKIFVDQISGDYQNIVGLPIDAIKNIMKNKKWMIKNGN